ncbi:Fc.00g036660.m01.CDS01 [Cosmosporella sp. VM-42]
MADSPESNVYNLVDTAMLPIKGLDVGRGGNTPWYTDGLPRNEVYSVPLAVPKADIHLGYPTDHTSHWKVEENTVIDHPVARRLTQPAEGKCFPFFLFEFKSEAMGGNHWQAENQAAGSGASCVNTMRWLFREAYPSEVHQHVHLYLAKDNQHYMSWIATCETMRQVQRSNHVVENTFDHVLGARQTKIREALALLYPFPDHCKSSRPASVIDAQNPSADDEDNASRKSQRTEY